MSKPRMKVYRADTKNDFKLLNHVNSRYGFNALFFTTNIELAEKYAESFNNKGTIYEFELNPILDSVDYKGRISHSSHFRSLIHRLYKEGKSSVIIKNVYDYPSFKSYYPNKSDLIVVFDFSEIISLKKYEQTED